MRLNIANLLDPPPSPRHCNDAKDYPLKSDYAIRALELMLFTHVSDAERILTDIIAFAQHHQGTGAGATATWSGIPPNCLSLDASLILDPIQLQLAATRANLYHQHGKKKTKTLASEVLFNLSPSVNISDAIKQFGISRHTRHILVVLLMHQDAIQEEWKQSLCEYVGKPMESMNVLPQLVDIPAICKLFKVKETAKTKLLPLVIDAMALKGHH